MLPIAHLRAAIVALVLLTGQGCAGAADTEEATPRGSRDRIAAEELATLQQLSALEVVERLRPAWLRIRAGSRPRVVLNGTPMEGGTEALANFRVGEIRELRYLSPSDATMRFGTGFPAGAILVVTGR